LEHLVIYINVGDVVYTV